MLFNPQLAKERVNAFLVGISPKVNAIVQVEFQLANYDVAVQHVSIYATETYSINYMY